MATVKRDYKSPEPPVEKCSICQGPLKPVVIYEAGEGVSESKWILSGWDCDKLHNIVYGVGYHEWPFVEDTADWHGLEAVGFVAV